MAHIQDRRAEGKGWRARYRGPDGRERSRTFARKVDAERWLTDQTGRKQRGEWLDPERAKTPLREIAERYMTTLTVKPKTRRGYESLLEGHILPVFGDRPIGSLDALEVREWVGELSSTVSASWTRQAYRLLRAIMGAAVEAGYISRSPCLGVRLPRLPQHDMLVVEPEALGRLADEAGDEGRLVLLTLAYSGMRWGELVALRRSRCHILRARLEVAENAVELDGAVTFGTPKGHERRQVAVPRFLTDALAEHLAHDVADEPDALVFTRDGHPLRHSWFYKRVFKPALRRAGLPEALRLHDLRHTCASILVREGANVVQVQTQLGHKDATTTLRVYSHMWPDDLDRVAEALERAHERAEAILARPQRGPSVVPMEQKRRSDG